MNIECLFYLSGKDFNPEFFKQFDWIEIHLFCKTGDITRTGSNKGKPSDDAYISFGLNKNLMTDNYQDNLDIILDNMLSCRKQLKDNKAGLIELTLYIESDNKFNLSLTPQHLEKMNKIGCELNISSAFGDDIDE